MRNPWIKKNPFMSMWLSAANTAIGSAIGSARGKAVSAAKREASAIQAEATRQVLDFWSGSLRTPPVRRKARKR